MKLRSDKILAETKGICPSKVRLHMVSFHLLPSIDHRKTNLIKSDYLEWSVRTSPRYKAVAHTVWISRNHHERWIASERRGGPYLNLSLLLAKIQAFVFVLCVYMSAIRRCCSQQVHPQPNTHKFVRLLWTDADWGVQSVRPTHQGYHHKRGPEWKVGGDYGMYLSARVSSWAPMGNANKMRCRRRIRQGWN